MKYTYKSAVAIACAVATGILLLILFCTTL
jgi:hypothetical protein